jgi:dGTPase
MSLRSHFERDRARILHSSALRRLGTKTQVLSAGFDDFVRTRLTHSLEVAQVGRDLAKQLGCSADIVDAACLAHDLGHPPFGHNGEQALREVAKDIGGFEGNAQTLRIITRLEPKVYGADGASAGLNLTRATIDATIKYPWTYEIAQTMSTHKFNVYEDDLPIFQWVKSSSDADRQHTKCLEAEVMDISDDISYSVHDIEDAIVSGAYPGSSLRIMRDESAFQLIFESGQTFYGHNFSIDELKEARQRFEDLGILNLHYDGTHRQAAVLKNSTSLLIGRFANAIYDETISHYSNSASTFTNNHLNIPKTDPKLLQHNPLTRYNAHLHIPRYIQAEIMLLKSFAAAYVMIPLHEKTMHTNEQHIIYDLVENIMTTNKLTPLFQEDYNNAETESARLRIAVDQIACLTDFSAKEMAQSLLTNKSFFI